MLFNSYDYFIFLSLILTLFYFLKGQLFKRFLLIIGSYLFYAGWNILFLPLLFGSTILDFYIGKKIFSTKEKGQKRNWLLASISLNVGILFLFKVSPNILTLFQYSKNDFSLLIPIGISFYTFQTLSYSIDIFRGKIIPEKDLSVFSLYVAFFPQILAGPIERASKLLPQLQRIEGSANLFFIGIKLILFGLFKKVIVADKLALIVDPIFNSPELFSGIFLLLGTVFFTFQIYCDFSGYTDIAIGTANLFGIKLSQNFNYPYKAKSLQEFWHRWHISLSTWFRDYVYFPLGGNKVKGLRWALNIFIVFFLSSIWHGIGITFLLWGSLHAFFLLIEVIYSKKVKTNLDLPFFKNIIVFIIITFLWIFFRAENLTDINIIFSKICSINIDEFSISKSYVFLNRIELGIIPFLIIICFLSFHILIEYFEIDTHIVHNDLKTQPRILELLVINIIIISLVLFGDWGGERFIYFQF